MKTVLITGGARGIGRTISEKFAKNGYNVIVNYSKSEEAAYMLEKEYSNIKTYKADISNKKEVNSMIEFANSEFKGIDILINNAGISSSGLLQDFSEEEINKIFSVNVNGSIFCAQAVLPSMISKKSGCIVNISSVWGMVGASNEVVYSASKAAIIGFSKALAKELGPSNIRVNCVAPGIIMTDMVSNYSVEEFDEIRSNIPLERIGSTDDIANAIYFLASDDASYITGQVISPNGGWVI